MAVPISITPFLASHLDKALETPSTHTIGPIFKILSGIGSHLLDALPSDLVARLQEQFKKLLQTVGTQQHMTDLVCLAVLAVMASSQSSSSTSQDELPSRITVHEASTVNQMRRCNEARQYLSKRAAKTLDLVVLKVIFVCSKSCTLTVSEVIESLRLCQTIVDTIDAGDRRSWMENDRGKLRKLVEKVSSYDRRSKVLCMVRPSSPRSWKILNFGKALHFITSLVGDRSLPHELLPVCKAVLCAPLASSLDHAVGIKILVRF